MIYSTTTYLHTLYSLSPEFLYQNSNFCSYHYLSKFIQLDIMMWPHVTLSVKEHACLDFDESQQREYTM